MIIDTALSFDTRQSQNDFVQTMPALAELLELLIKALIAKIAEEKNKQKQEETSSPKSEQRSEGDSQEQNLPTNAPVVVPVQGINQENETNSAFNAVVTGSTESKQLSGSAAIREVENKIAAAAAANLCQEMGTRHASGIAYKSDDYLIHGSENPNGSMSYNVRSVELDGTVRRVLDFTVSAESQGAESITVHDAPLSEHQRKEFIDAAKAIASNPTELGASSYTVQREKLGSLAPYGTRAAAYSHKILDDFRTNTFTPVLDINSTSDPYTISKVEDRIVITDNASGSVILSATDNIVNAEKFSAKNQADFRQLVEMHGVRSAQSPQKSEQPEAATTSLQAKETALQPNGFEEEVKKTEFVTEDLTADELCEWINAIQATGGSDTDLNEALAYASEARRGHPDEFEKLKQKGGADKNKNNHGKQSGKKISIQMPAHLAEKRNGAVRIFKEMESDYGTQEVIQIINDQRTNPVKIVNPDAQIGKDANGKIKVKGKGAARNQQPKNQQKDKGKTPALATAAKSKGFER
jgi:hypothetical protein